jgi:site-specific DNA recombinase
VRPVAGRRAEVLAFPYGKHDDQVDALAFLAPSIVGAILEGRQPADLSLKQLMYRTDLAASWHSQRQQLGFQT